ncbi:DUF421 domain-containing protein [Robiginitomaculum antarcticum]|uniref:DUF421 domain-containing protein n=1 Tax=Robiginitomaculum antarcticum TaxID=437507 RepID=UPI0003A1992C|nr:YetF domain-containing protein [Robiginitomaculum antarcticum]
MFFENLPDFDLLARSIILGPAGLIWVVIIVRIIGLRTFSKMTAFDFISTVATGSLLANAASATDWPAFIQAILAMAAILALQWLIARLKRDFPALSKAIENEPLILVDKGMWNEKALNSARIADNDVWAKLREANVFKLDNLQTVVLETTGDISVLPGDSLDREVLTGAKIKP